MRLSRSLAAAACAALLAIACSSSPDASGVGLSDGCNVNTDCNAPLVCAFQRCHNQCAASRDCPDNERCVASDRPYSVCQLPDEKGCASNAKCPLGQVCAQDSQCRDGCTVDRDCIAGQVCVSGACADPSELVDGGLPVSGDAGAGGVSCVLNSDCAKGLVCKSGVCSVECRMDVDCAVGDSCVNSRCVGGDATLPIDGGADAPDGYGSGCVLQSDCPSSLVCTNGRCVYECNGAIDCAGASTCCFQHKCTTGAVCTQSDGGADGGSDACKACSSNDQCDDGLYCNGPEQCFAGCCARALDTPCDSHSACIKDVCDETTKACSHATQAGTDVDGDGHLAIGCVGGDDCNDNDATIYAGARELCDGKDNDCNGLVDDHSRSPYGAVTTSGGNVVYGSGAAAPAGTEIAMFLGTRITYGPEIDGQGFDANRVAQGNPHSLVTVTAGSNGGFVLDADGEPGGGAVVAYDTLTNGVGYSRFLSFFSVTNNTFTETHRYTIVPVAQATPGTTDANINWTGSAFLVGWAGTLSADAGAASPVGVFAQYAADGSIAMGSQNVITPDASGQVLGRVRVSGSPSGLGVAYQLPDRTLMAATYGSSGTPIAHVVIAAAQIANVPLVQAIGGTAGGYVVAWSDNAGLHGTFVSTAGVVGTTVLASSNAPIDGDGSTDGVGAAFAFRYPSNVTFGYAHGDLSTGALELSTAYSPPTANAGDMASLSGFNTRLGVSYFASTGAGFLAYVAAGCH